MKLQTENSQIRRRSNSSVLYLFIPYLNYLFFFFQARGAYISIKNYYQFNKKLPNLVRTLVITLKYAVYGTVVSVALYSILFLFSFNTFGPVATYYVGLLHDVTYGLFYPGSVAYLFGEVPSKLVSISYKEGFTAVSAVIFTTYLVFGILGSLLALYNIKSDRKRNLMDY